MVEDSRTNYGIDTHGMAFTNGSVRPAVKKGSGDFKTKGGQFGTAGFSIVAGYHHHQRRLNKRTPEAIKSTLLPSMN